MPRAKPSSWQPKGIELFAEFEEFEKVLGPEWMDAVIVALKVPPSRLTERGEIEDAVRDIAGQLYAQIYYRSRPSGGQKKAALKKLRQQLAAAFGSLDGLDGDSLKLIGQIAAEDKEPQPDDLPPRFYSGDHRVQSVRRRLAKLQQWVLAAEQRLSRDDAGRTKFDAERRAVTELLSRWRRTRPPLIGVGGGRKIIDPTGPQLTALAQAALGPIHRAFGIEANLRSICEEVLPGVHSRK